jgi:hypothetical protein
MQTIEVVKDYPMLGYVVENDKFLAGPGYKLKKGTILKEVESPKRGTTIFEDNKGNKFHFDNSEIVFSYEFQKSFKLISKE